MGQKSLVNQTFRYQRVKKLDKLRQPIYRSRTGRIPENRGLLKDTAFHLQIIAIRPVCSDFCFLKPDT